jgi:hypothetical protein
MGKKIQLTTTEEKVQQNVNLHHVGRQAPQIARKGKISIDRRRIPILDWWFLNASPKEKFRMELKVKPSADLTIRDLSKLLQVSLIGEDTSIGGFEIQQNVTSYVVEFFPDEVLDCQIVETCHDGSEDSVFPIEYEIHLIRIRKNELVQTITGKIDVRIEPISRVEPSVKLKIREEYEKGIVFSGNRQGGPVHIGDLQVRNSGRFFRSPAISMTISLDADVEGEPVPRLIELDGGGTNVQPSIVGGRPLLNPRRHANGNIGANGCCSSCSVLNGKANIIDLVVQPGQDHYVSFPVYLNMDRMSNPSSDVRISVLATAVYRKYYESTDTRNTIVSESGVILLKRNTRIMALEVFAGPEGAAFTDDCRIDNNTVKELDAEYFAWSAENEVHPSLNYEYIINNSADIVEEGRENAAIIIKDMTVTTPEPADGAHVVLKRGNRFPNEMFKIEYPAGVVLLKSDSDPLVIAIKYTDEFLDHIEKTEENGNVEIFNAFVEFKVAFKYCIDKTGLYEASPEDYPFKSFETTLRFRIFKRAKPEWFCLDFGTSALVASFARSLNEPEEKRLVSLAEKKKELDQKVWTAPEASEDAGEGSPFLISSSAVLAHTNFSETFLQSDKYGTAAVLFSPPSLGYDRYYIQLLPCLKSLVGNKYLPQKLIPIGTRRQQNANRIDVNDILKVIYGQLFRFFIPESIKKTQRMVISYPNTFAMSHIELIKSLAKDSMERLRDDYLRFISESDAVAFYYNHHRQSFIENSNLRNLPADFDKHVLVYDMGAGTLDLTYFVRTRVRTGKNSAKTRIAIKGKLGMNKAGNYLDYVLADILIRLLVEKEEIKNSADVTLPQKLLELITVRNVPASRSLTDAFVLKDYVKNTLKPHLDDSETSSLPGKLSLFGTSMPLNEITLKEIIENEEFQDFQEGITKRVFENFVALFGDGDEQSRNLPVNLVLFSGRMTGSLSLRRAVKNALNVFGPQDKNIMFADLSSRKFIDIDTPVGSITGLKTVVVDGALAFCRGRRGFELVNSNVYATYGAFLVSNESEVTWLPLIDYRTKPIMGRESASDDGITIREYNTRFSRANTTSPINPEAVDLADYRSIIIVQTYSKDPLADWNANRRELISVIGKRDLEVPEGANSVQPIRLRIDHRNNHLTFSIGNEPQELMPHDDYESDTFARAMWPIVMRG